MDSPGRQRSIPLERHYAGVLRKLSLWLGLALAVNIDATFQGHIAFVRNHQLYILNGKDGKVSAVPAGNNVQDPAYSPDGSRLAYVRRGANWSDLMVIPAKGGTPAALTHNQGDGQNTLCANGASEEDSAWAAN